MPENYVRRHLQNYCSNDNATLGCYDFNYVSRVFQCGSLEKEKNMNHLKTFRQFIKEEDGMGTVEVILIIVEK